MNYLKILFDISIVLMILGFIIMIFINFSYGLIISLCGLFIAGFVFIGRMYKEFK